jgi:ferric-dicitrate binding protein FerR (iron transport regulator)
MRTPDNTTVAPPLVELVATSERIEGAPVLRRTIGGRSVASPIVPNTTVQTDDLVETDDASRVAMRTADGSSIRLDRRTHARVLSPQVIELIDGAVYVATADTSKGFEVRTPMGTLRDVGTQFEVRLDGPSLRLRVRTGLVEVHRGGQTTPARAGTEVTVAPTGIASTTIAIYGPDWDWTAQIAAPFAIEGKSLAAFLEHLAREQGWILRYPDPAIGRAATGIVLRGSVDGLPAQDALDVALATTGLQSRLEAGELIVFRPSGGR